MTFENCYIVLSWADGTCDRYSDEFTCDEDELLVNVRKFIEKNKNDFAEDIAVYVNDEDGYFEYRTKLRHDTINNHVDEAMKSIVVQIKKYIDEQSNN